MWFPAGAGWAEACGEVEGVADLSPPSSDFLVPLRDLGLHGSLAVVLAGGKRGGSPLTSMDIHIWGPFVIGFLFLFNSNFK